jgi:hypothetical protein
MDLDLRIEGLRVVSEWFTLKEVEDEEILGRIVESLQTVAHELWIEQQRVSVEPFRSSGGSKTARPGALSAGEMSRSIKQHLLWAREVGNLCLVHTRAQKIMKPTAKLMEELGMGDPGMAHMDILKIWSHAYSGGDSPPRLPKNTGPAMRIGVVRTVPDMMGNDESEAEVSLQRAWTPETYAQVDKKSFRELHRHFLAQTWHPGPTVGNQNPRQFSWYDLEAIVQKFTPELLIQTGVIAGI